MASPVADPTHPAALAEARVGRAGTLLGALGMGSSLFAVFRVLETWRVGSGAASHRISMLGHSLSYPAANLPAIVVVALALVGLATTVLLVAGALRELEASRRLRRFLLAHASYEIRGALVIVDDRPRAFCAGMLRPRVYVSTGAVALLDEHALHALVAHERHHVRRRDPLRLAVARIVARALFYTPGLGELARRRENLAELSADESVISAGAEHRSALARVMLAFSEASRPGDPTGIEPERVDHVLGDPPSWRFPVLPCLLVLPVLGLLVGAAMLAGRLASGSATLALPVLSHRPCVVLATIPAISAVAALWRLLHDRGGAAWRRRAGR